MPEITINGRSLPAGTSVHKLAPARTLDAAAAMRTNGADDLIVSVNGDHLAVSGRGLRLEGLAPGSTVRVDGHVGRVVHVDRQLNSFGEGMRAWPGLVVGGAGVAWGLIGFVQGLLTGSAFAGLGLFIALAGLAAGAAVNLVPAIWGATREVDQQALGRFGG